MSAVGFIVAHVRADAAFCVGAPEMEGASHLPVAVDPRTGAPVVPVSGLIGSLRAHAASVRPADADRLFGTIDGDSDGPSPSVVRGLGTVVTVNGAAVTAADVQERAQTAVDRRRGAAASSSFRTSQAVNSGADIALMLEVLDTTCLAEVVELVATWRPTVGGRGTTGMGAATVTALHSGQLDPATPEGMRLLLTRSGPDLVAAVSSTEHRVRPAEAIEVRRYRFRSNGPLLIRGAKDSNGTMALQRSGQFHVDGSSWKGVFRSGCEFAILSAAGARGVEPSLVAVDLLFGTASRRGLLRFEETPLVAARESPRIHVAIDRVTGGASNDRLFTDTPVEGAYAELRITVPYPVPDWVGVLLDAVAADLDDGYLALGGATSRGYGTISVDSSPTATGLGGCLESVLAGEDLATPVPGGFPSGSDA